MKICSISTRISQSHFKDFHSLAKYIYAIVNVVIIIPFFSKKEITVSHSTRNNNKMVVVPPPGNKAYWNKKLQFFFIIPISPFVLFVLLPSLCSVLFSNVQFCRLLQLKRLTKSKRRIEVKDRDSLNGVWQQLQEQVGNYFLHLRKFLFIFYYFTRLIRTCRENCI